MMLLPAALAAVVRRLGWRAAARVWGCGAGLAAAGVEGARGRWRRIAAGERRHGQACARAPGVSRARPCALCFTTSRRVVRAQQIEGPVPVARYKFVKYYRVQVFDREIFT